MKNEITILGTGAWGTALANVLLENNNIVKMWGIDSDEIHDLKNQLNKKYYGLKKLVKKPHLVTTNLKEAISDSKIILLAIPSKFLIKTLEEVKKIIKNKKIILINVAKGIDPETKLFWSQIIKKTFNKNLNGLVSLLGPSFASEVFDKELTVINAVSSNLKALKIVTQLFCNKYFKLVPIQNEIGADIFAALKNVAAIGTGIIYQLHPSINTRSAILACAFKEIYQIYQRIVNENKPSNIGYELCAIGDLTLTCTSEKSRNFSFGLEIGKNGFKKTIAKNNKTVEGYVAAKIINEILTDKKIKAPIITAIYNILYKNADHKKLSKIITK